mmetsp:Transcript_71228/g.196643  ORF Transcript_71228/g.196643 Transcript_71228/m.196643 type:complete len:228 (+) Transcript_71228:585-1268(+)
MALQMMMRARSSFRRAGLLPDSKSKPSASAARGSTSTTPTLVPKPPRHWAFQTPLLTWRTTRTQARDAAMRVANWSSARSLTILSRPNSPWSAPMVGVASSTGRDSRAITTSGAPSWAGAARPTTTKWVPRWSSVSMPRRGAQTMLSDKQAFAWKFPSASAMSLKKSSSRREALRMIGSQTKPSAQSLSACSAAKRTKSLARTLSATRSRLRTGGGKPFWRATSNAP